MIAVEAKSIETRFKWFKHIPSNWNLMRLKNICGGELQYGINIPSNKYSDHGVRFLRTTDINEDGEVIPNGIYIPKKAVPENYILQKGDLLFSRSGTVGRCYLHDSDKEYCFAGFLVKFKPENYLLSKWMYYTSLTKEFKYQIFSEAIESTISNFNGNKYAVIRITFPKDKKELESIVEYLDFNYSEIKNFIQTKQRFIEILKEQRQSIITNAVTKGIDENAKMKATVLGEIPEHWEVRRLGTIGRFSKGGNISRSELIYTDEGVPAILYGDLYTKYDIVAENIINRITKETASKSVELKKGDLLFTGSGETKEDIGKCVIFNSDEPAYAGGDVIIFKQAFFDSYFISYSQNSSKAKYQKAISSKGEIIVHTYGSKLRDVIMPYPPTIEEQKQIVEHIKSETRTLDIAISKAEREIELIKEYREAMIAEAVTGKMKL